MPRLRVKWVILVMMVLVAARVFFRRVAAREHQLVVADELQLPLGGAALQDRIDPVIPPPRAPEPDDRYFPGAAGSTDGFTLPAAATIWLARWFVTFASVRIADRYADRSSCSR